jgi:hypothetical protein
LSLFIARHALLGGVDPAFADELTRLPTVYLEPPRHKRRQTAMAV